MIQQGSAEATVDQLTDRSRGTWSAGDYDRISLGFRAEAEAFVDRLKLKPGMAVLDAACGSGNLTIPAARAGATVTGLDLVPSLLVAATRWAESDRLDIAFDQGNAESLPYPDQSFDVVMSMFGVMFAARPHLVIRELARVTKPGGRVALANWTKSGFIGQMLSLHVAMVPPPPGMPGVLGWGDRDTILDRFDARDWNVTLTPRVLTFRYPFSPAGTAELFRGSYGPTVRVFESIDEDGRVHFSDQLRALWEGGQRMNSAATEVDAEYIEVVAVRR